MMGAGLREVASHSSATLGDQPSLACRGLRGDVCFSSIPIMG
jgi:hypothetical protein